MWFDDWTALLQIILKAAIGFAVLVLLLRVAGKRTITKLNAFDLVLVFTVGSILATMILDNNTTVSEGLVALSALVALHWVTAWMSTRSARIRQLIKSTPTLLAYDGQMLADNMRRERIAEIELLAALRQHGVHDLSEVKAAVLETEGEISVLKNNGADPSSALRVSGIDVPARDDNDANKGNKK